MTPRPSRLVVVGSLVGDGTVRVPHLPDRAGTVIGDSARAQTGGGYVTMSAAARLGLPAAVACRVGDGPFAMMIAARLAREGMELLLPRVSGEQGFSFGLIEPDGERTFVTAPGVESTVTEAELAAVEVLPGDAIVVSGYDLVYPDAGPAIMAWASQVGDEALFVFDPGPLVAEIPEPLLDLAFARADVVGLNRREAALLTGQPADNDHPDARDWFFGELKRPDVVVLLREGSDGCRVVRRGTDDVSCPAPAVEALDTTGAGDVHTGAFLAELARGADVVEAARVATVAASMSVREAVAAGGPTRAELDAFLAGL